MLVLWTGYSHEVRPGQGRGCDTLSVTVKQHSYYELRLVHHSDALMFRIAQDILVTVMSNQRISEHCPGDFLS